MSYYYAVTVSPQTMFHIHLDLIQEIVEKYFSKYKDKINNYAYCLELGSKGQHPHCHLLVEYNYERRSDKVKEQIQRVFSSGLSHSVTPQFVKVKKAFNPYSWLTVYMKKENLVFVDSGFDLKLLKEISTKSSAHFEVIMKGQNLMKLTRSNFNILYKELLEDDKLTPYPPLESTFKCLSEYFTKVVAVFDDEGYQIHFLIYNRKQVKMLMQYESGLTIQE